MRDCPSLGIVCQGVARIDLLQMTAPEDAPKSDSHAVES